MNPNLTEIVMILDASGSMMPLCTDTIGGYNSFIDQQRELPGQAAVTTVLFNDGYDLLHDHVSLEDIKPITAFDYIPMGMTALYDAVGRTIDIIGARLANTPEDERPSKVVFVITTDGEENASREYTGVQVKNMIEHQRDKYSWEFLFIGAGIDAYKASSAIGIDSFHTASYAATMDGISNVYCSASKGIGSIRGAGGGCITADWKNTDAEITGVVSDIHSPTPVATMTTASQA